MRDRFVLKLAAGAVVVALIAFVAAYQLLDDGGFDPPPRGAGRAAAVSTTSTTASTTTTTAPDEFPTPSWVAIVASEGDRAPADAAAAEVAANGYPAGVLRSDDYSSLKAGLWVGYAGPYESRDAAEAVVDRLEADGIEGAYVRCIGSQQECGGDRSGSGGGGGDGDGEGDD